MKRLEFIVKHPGCVRIRINDDAGEKFFYIETEGVAKSFSADISGESFKITLTPLIPAEKKSSGNKLGEKIVDKLISAGEKYAKDLFFFTECVYLVENFSDGDKINLDVTVYSFRSNDAADELWIWTDVVLFPVQYFFYDALLNGQRLIPAETNCLNRKKVLKRAKLFMFMGRDGIQLISYPIQLIRNRRLSTPKKIHSTLLKFAQMDTESRMMHTDESSVFEIVHEDLFDKAADHFVEKN